MRLLRLRPSVSLLWSRDCLRDHGIVMVTRDGFRVNTEGKLWFLLPWWKLLENAVISSIAVGLVTGSVVDATRPHLCSISPEEF